VTKLIWRMLDANSFCFCGYFFIHQYQYLFQGELISRSSVFCSFKLDYDKIRKNSVLLSLVLNFNGSKAAYLIILVFSWQKLCIGSSEKLDLVGIREGLEEVQNLRIIDSASLFQKFFFQLSTILLSVYR